MAKRRNPKKEKAQRNKAYARQFRKPTNSGRFFKNRNSSMNGNRDENSENSENSEDN
jgi:hypothetical protein